MPKMGSEIGVSVANPDQSIQITGQTFADSVLWLHVHNQNLIQVLEELRQENPHGENERLATVQSALQGLTNATKGVLDEHLRVAREQGLRFEIVPKPGDLH